MPKLTRRREYPPHKVRRRRHFYKVDSVDEVAEDTGLLAQLGVAAARLVCRVLERAVLVPDANE